VNAVAKMPSGSVTYSIGAYSMMRLLVALVPPGSGRAGTATFAGAAVTAVGPCVMSAHGRLLNAMSCRHHRNRGE